MEESRIQKLNWQQILALEPNLREYPEEADFAYEEGAVDPIRISKLLVNRLFLRNGSSAVGKSCVDLGGKSNVLLWLWDPTSSKSE